MDKWGKEYWTDVAERVGSTLIYGLITFLTLDNTTKLDIHKLWPVVLLPAVLSLLKAVLSNMKKSNLPTASLASVSSTKAHYVEKGERGATTGEFLVLAFAILGIVLLVLLLVGGVNFK